MSRPVVFLVLCFATTLTSVAAHGAQFVCTVGESYASQRDGKLRPQGSDAGKLFTVDTSTGIVQGDLSAIVGAYRVMNTGGSQNAARLIASGGKWQGALYIHTYAAAPHAFVYVDGVKVITGTCRPSD
jgi:hypothetical protein